MNFLKNLVEYFLKFKDPAGISKQLTVLTKC